MAEEMKGRNQIKGNFFASIRIKDIDRDAKCRVSRAGLLQSTQKRVTTIILVKE